MSRPLQAFHFTLSSKPSTEAQRLHPAQSTTPAPIPFADPAKQAPVSKGFFMPGWSAPKKIEGEWTCGSCMLKNPASETEKCQVCETPRPK